MNKLELMEKVKRAKLDSLNSDVERLEKYIVERAELGCSDCIFDVTHKENIVFVMNHFRDMGLKVKRLWLFHSASNTIEVKW